MRPLLRAAKLGDRMLATVRQVVEVDSEFRGRVAEVADEERLGRLPWLWLVRPEGWEQEVDSLLDASEAMAEQMAQERDARVAQQRVAALEDELARANAELTMLRRINEGASAEVETERKARRDSESQRQQIESSLQAAQTQMARLRSLLEDRDGRIASLATELSEAKKGAIVASADRDDWRREAGRLEQELARATAAAQQAGSEAETARESVADAVGRAAAAAFDLASALDDATVALGGSAVLPGASPEPGVITESQHEMPGPDAGGSLTAETGRDSLSRRPGRDSFPFDARPRRTPVRLPPAVFDDSVKAAEHLVRVPDVLLVVDGYNVTLSSWPELELPEQRRRLVDALAELAAKAGTSVELVFDGVEDGGWLHPPPAVRGRMRVQFSPSEVEADEVIIELVNRLDVLQPIIVATDDRRVRSEVSRAGANVISVAQLLAVLGRSPSFGR
jgi:predicted RNA-binding protein with PIN domain